MPEHNNSSVARGKVDLCEAAPPIGNQKSNVTEMGSFVS